MVDVNSGERRRYGFATQSHVMPRLEVEADVNTSHEALLDRVAPHVPIPRRWMYIVPRRAAPRPPPLTRLAEMIPGLCAPKPTKMILYIVDARYNTPPVIFIE